MDIEKRITAAWQGRISGCLLGKPVEGLSMQQGSEKLNNLIFKFSTLGILPLSF